MRDLTNFENLSNLSLDFFTEKQHLMYKKENVLRVLQNLPERFELTQLLDRLILLKKVEEGLQDFENGNHLTLEESMKRHEKWLKGDEDTQHSELPAS